MEEQTLVTIAGNPITIGLAVSWLVYVLKKTPWFPLFKGEVVRIRATVGVLCTVLSAVSLYISGSDVLVPFYGLMLPDPVWVIQAFYGYFVASAAYVHLFKD